MTSGQFTSTIKTSESVAAIANGPTGISWDGANTLWPGATITSRKLYLQSGQFTSTLKDSQRVTIFEFGPNGISWDGVNTPWSGGSFDKLYLQSGKFTSTLKTSQSIQAIDTSLSDISWNGTDTLWCGLTGQKLYLQSGQFTSTLKTSEGIVAIDTSVTGIDTNDFNSRITVSMNSNMGLSLTGCGIEVTPSTAALLSRVSDTTIQIFQDGIDALISQLGKSIKLVYLPTIIECPNCINDTIGNKPANRFRPGPMRFSDGKRCPYCRGTQKTEQENSEIIQGLIQVKPRDYKRYGISVQDPGGLVSVKTFMSDVIKIERTTHAIIDIQKQSIIKIKCRKVGEPIPTGLRHSRYAVSFWQRM